MVLNKSPEGLKGKLEAGKGAPESKGLRVTVKMTNLMISGEEAREDQKGWKFPCTACRKGVGTSSSSSESVEYIGDVEVA